MRVASVNVPKVNPIALVCPKVLTQRPERDVLNLGIVPRPDRAGTICGVDVVTDIRVVTDIGIVRKFKDGAVAEEICLNLPPLSRHI